MAEVSAPASHKRKPVGKSVTKSASRERSSRPIALDAESPAGRLYADTRLVQLSFTRLSEERTLTPAQRAKAAEQFKASTDAVKARKRLYSRAHSAVRNLYQSERAIEDLWKSYSLPFERGRRLMPESDLLEFRSRFEVLRDERYLPAVQELAARMWEVKEQAKGDLGELYDDTNYGDPMLACSVAISYPAVDPPSYLMQLDPQLYREEASRVQATFTQAAAEQERLFLEAFNESVSELLKAMNGLTTGERKRMGKGRAQALFSLLDEWRQKMEPYGIGRGSQLESQLRQLQGAVSGYDTESLARDIRKQQNVREDLLGKMSKIGGVLSGLLENMPRRRVTVMPREDERHAEGGNEE
jgi:hypothetical protein